MDDLLTIIENNNALPDVTTNFNALREEGTAYIAQLGHKLWTDFNTHDPGITMLEVLCFAINDLAFRTDFSIEDLLASEHPSKDKKHFFSAAEILTCNPVTPLDFRKLIIDVDGVKNAWLFKGVKRTGVGEDAISLNGLYDICIELDNEINPENNLLVEEIKEQVRQKLCAHRNLAEDFLNIDIIGQKPISLKVDINIASEADANEVQAQIIYKVESFLSFYPSFYSLEEMLDKGYSCDDVFQSAILENGFLEDTELESAKLRRVIYKSDLYQEIMNVTGVESIVDLTISLSNKKKDEAGDNYQNGWCLDICQKEQEIADKGSVYEAKILCKHKAVLDRQASKFTIKKESVVLPTNAHDVKEKIQLLELINQKPPIHSTLDNPIPKGTYRNLNQYASIQEDFPLVYRVGKDQIPNSFRPKRIALVKQLKGFLTFFDQILANYLGQLGNLKNSLSICPNTDDRGLFTKSLKGLDAGIDALFFDWYQVTSQSIANLSGKLTNEDLQKIKTLQAYPPQTKKDFEETLNKIFDSQETLKDNILAVSQLPDFVQNQLKEITENPLERHNRRNQVLDHLIARFGEQFTDYALSLYPVCADDPCKSSPVKLKDTLLDCKTDFLKNIPIIGRDRGKGFNYKSEDCIKKELFWNAENVAGLKRRVSKLLCLKDSKRVQLSCEPNLEVVKKIDEQRKVFTWVVVEKGIEPENPDAIIFLQGMKEYTLRSKAKKDQEKITTALFDSQALVSNSAILEVKENTTDSPYYLALTAGPVLAQSIGFKEKEDADNLKIKLIEALFPPNCETEGFHVLEHILLRPVEGTDIQPLAPIELDKDCIIKDPYSFWISIIALDSWNRCQKENGSRAFFEQLVRRETPAHIGVNFCWLSGQKMYHFELAYKNWLYDLARPAGDKCEVEESQNNLIELLNMLFTKPKENTTA